MIRILALVAALLTALPVLAQNRRGEHWVATWGTALVGRPQTPPAPAPQASQPAARTPAQPANPPAPPPRFNNQTIRQIVRTSIGGERVRVVLSNAFGTAPLAVGAAHIAIHDKDAAIVPRSGKPLTFSRKTSFTIPPRAVVVSDPVDITVPAQDDVAIDLYLPGDTGATVESPLTTHFQAFQTNYISTSGNHTAADALPVQTTVNSWFLLARLEVMAAESVGTLVTLGDSITDGTRSTPNTNNRWPDHLVRRLKAEPGGIRLGVANVGISGNRVLSDSANAQSGVNALARFERDVLMQPGVTHVVVLEGINDIGGARQNPSPSADDLIAGHLQLIERARARGIRIFGATLTPFEGANYFTQEGEAKRQALNQWIRTSGAYDAVIDFDAAVRDPNQPSKMLPKYDSGDHLHPGDAGYEAMAKAVNLALLANGESR
jgi:lysophospholipase L1-like esterase